MNTWFLLLVCLVWLAVNVRWLLTFRRRQVLDIDEAGYLGMALNDYYAGIRDGLDGWFHTVTFPSIQAPLTTTLTSIQFYVTGTSVIISFAIPLLAGLAVVLLTYGLAHRVGGRALAWPAVLLVAAAPRLLVESRAYHFAAPAAAITTAALFCLVRSERLSRTGYSIGFGVLLGLMPLTRTMTIAYVPPLLLAAGLQSAIGPDARRRLLHLAGAVVLAVGVAATWLVPSGRLVFRYLIQFGYGQQAEEFGEQGGLLNLSSWTAHLEKFINEHYLPHSLLLFVGCLAGLYVLIRRVGGQTFPAYLRMVVASPVMPIAMLAVGGIAAFVSSRNEGIGFTLPLIPAITVTALWGLYRAHDRLRKAAPVAVVLISLIALLPMLDLRVPIARPWLVKFPVFAHEVTVTDGRGAPQTYAGSGLNTRVPMPVGADAAQQWIVVNDWGAQQIVDNHALGGKIAFGLRDRLFNVNTVQLALLRKKGYGVQVTEVKPTEVGNTLPDYQRWLTEHPDSLSGDASEACLLFTATGTVNEFEPVVDPPAMARAAETSGFARVASHEMPNGRMLTLWHRDHPTCGE